MATRLRDDLPDPLREIRTRPLFVMRLDVRPLQIVGGTPGVYRNRQRNVGFGSIATDPFRARVWRAQEP